MATHRLTSRSLTPLITDCPMEEACDTKNDRLSPTNIKTRTVFDKINHMPCRTNDSLRIKVHLRDLAHQSPAKQRKWYQNKKCHSNCHQPYSQCRLHFGLKPESEVTQQQIKRKSSKIPFINGCAWRNSKYPNPRIKQSVNISNTFLSWFLNLYCHTNSPLLLPAEYGMPCKVPIPQPPSGKQSIRSVSTTT